MWLIIVLILVLYLCFASREEYGWSCTYTPNKDYYKQDWLMGDFGDRFSYAIKQY